MDPRDSILLEYPEDAEKLPSALISGRECWEDQLFTSPWNHM